jgi:hypothetical protein
MEYTKGVQLLLALLVVGATVYVIYTMARKWAVASAPPPEPDDPHAAFDGGEHYATDDERLRVETDGPSGAGEGVLMALVDALRARGYETNHVEPETYGFSTVVEIDGADVVLHIGAGGDCDWMLWVKTSDQKVPAQVEAALRTLDVRNIRWISARR